MARQDVVKTISDAGELLRACRGHLWMAQLQTKDLVQEQKQELENLVLDLDALIVSALDEVYDLPEIERRPLRELEEEIPT